MDTWVVPTFWGLWIMQWSRTWFLNIVPNLSCFEQKELPFVPRIKAINFLLKKEFRNWKNVKQKPQHAFVVEHAMASAGFPSCSHLPSCLMSSFRCAHLCRCLHTCVHCLCLGGWCLPCFSDWEVGSPGPVRVITLSPPGLVWAQKFDSVPEFLPFFLYSHWCIFITYVFWPMLGAGKVNKIQLHITGSIWPVRDKR